MAAEHEHLVDDRADRLAREALALRATSGAPVVDEAGHVIAINLGSGVSKGKTLGFGNSVRVFGPAIAKALASRR